MSENETGEPVDPKDQQTPEEQESESAAPEASADSAPAADSSDEEAAGSEDGADAEAALDAVEGAVADLAEETAEAAVGANGDAQSMDLPDLAGVDAAEGAGGMDLLSDVNLDVKIELGRTMMYVEDVLKLAQGAVVELNKLAGDPVDVYVNDRHVARGEVLILNDNFCVRINEILHAIGQD